MTTAGGPTFFLKRDNLTTFSTMQIKLFTIPISDGGAAQQEMNTFLKGHKNKS